MTRCLTFALLGTLLGAPMYAQTVGAIISGVVTDETGARLPGVTITITNASNGRTHTLITGTEGAYRAVALQPAPYRITAALEGFSPFTQDVTLTVGADSTLDVRLGLAGLTASVNVDLPTPSIEAARHQPSSIVTDEQIRALPELGRNFLVLAQLLPGSGPLNASVTRFATTKFGGAADQRSGFTTLIDGGDVDDAQWGSPTVNLTQESVQEFKVFRYQFDAQYGHALNAVVSVATRSGGNRFDGSAFYFGRDDALNARYFFANEKPPFAERRLGGSLGGPFARNRTHFFGTVEFDDVETVRVIAHPASSRFAARENGVFPATSNDRLAVFKLDHRFSAAHSGFVRHAYANQEVVRSVNFPTSDTNQTDTTNRAHSLVAEEDWIASPRTVNAFRIHVFAHTNSGVAHRADRGVAETRQTVALGVTNGGDQLRFPRTEVALSNTVYTTTASHDLKFGGELGFGINRLESQFFQDGLFTFPTDAPFNPQIEATWPIRFLIQTPSVHTYRSRQIALFVQDDWRVADRIRVNIGLRYDLEPTLRINDFYKQALKTPELAALGTLVSGDRGADTNNLQPRIGATFDLRGDGTRVLRGGWGMYVARNRPWFQVRSMNQLASAALLIEDTQRLRLYPDVAAVTAGGGLRQVGTAIPDDFVQAYSLNTTAGVGWQVGRVSTIDVDYIHTSGVHQIGTTDRNLPATERLSDANPRPLPNLGQVGMLENFSESWYDALESQLRTRFGSSGSLQVSYTLSRTYLDGVDFYSNQRGTQRTPRERGYSPSDQRHNFTAAATIPFPGQFQVSGILKLVSGSPMAVQTGTDLDGDRSLAGDRPPGLPITVGRGDVQSAIRLINEFRASVSQPPVDPTLLRLDPYRTLDIRLTKMLSLGSDRHLELLMEAFNVTNHVNYVPTVVIRGMSSAQFLRRTGARDARQVQWGLRFVF